MLHWQGPTYTQGSPLRQAASQEHWAEAATVACAQAGLDDGTWEMYPSGSDIVLGDGSRVFKMSHPKWASEIQAEIETLGALRGKLPIQTPAVLASGELDGWPWLIMSKIPGQSLASVWGGLSQADRRRLARDLGQIIAALHALPVSRQEESSWTPFLKKMETTARERMESRGCPPALAAQIDPFIKGATAWEGRPLVRLHTEILDEHVWVQKIGGKVEITGLLDFADSRVGHPGYEFPALAEFIFKGERPLLRECLLGYGLSPKHLTPALSRSLLRWGLTHQFGSVKRMIKALQGPPPKDLDALALALYGLDT